MFYKVQRIYPSFLISLLVACNTWNPLPDTREAPVVEAEVEPESVAVTIWTEKTEVFMEYPVLAVGEEASFAVHLTELKNFKPVVEGRLENVFTHSDGEVLTSHADQPIRNGIYIPRATFPKAGIYSMEIRIDGNQLTDIIEMPDVKVWQQQPTSAAESEANQEEFISYLKEQQWITEFRTEEVNKKTLRDSLPAVGTIRAKTQMHALIPAPVNGTIQSDQNEQLPNVGAWVAKGKILAVISPPADAKSGVNTIRMDYLLAKAEFERAQRLFDNQAISEKRLTEARIRFEASQAGYQTISEQVAISSRDIDSNSYDQHVHLKAPIDGFVEEIHFHLGEVVDTGQNLFTITNPSRIVLDARIPVSQIARVNNTRDASFTVEGYPQEFSVSDLDGQLISVGRIVDEDSRTIPVRFELSNPDNLLKIGMFAEVSVKTGASRQVLAIPNQAVVDDNGLPVAFVQVDGESFSKRVLQTGITDGGMTEIINGIQEGERVVTLGAYQVRLASVSTALPEHGHPH